MLTIAIFAFIAGLSIFLLFLISLRLSPLRRGLLGLAVAIVVMVAFLFFSFAAFGERMVILAQRPVVAGPTLVMTMVVIAAFGRLDAQRSQARWQAAMWSRPTAEQDFGRYCVSQIRKLGWSTIRVDYHSAMTPASIAKNGLHATVVFLSNAKEPATVLARLTAMSWPKVGRILIVTRTPPLSAFRREAAMIGVSVLHGQALGQMERVCRAPISVDY